MSKPKYLALTPIALISVILFLTFSAGPVMAQQTTVEVFSKQYNTNQVIDVTLAGGREFEMQVNANNIPRFIGQLATGFNGLDVTLTYDPTVIRPAAANRLVFDASGEDTVVSVTPVREPSLAEKSLPLTLFPDGNLLSVRAIDSDGNLKYTIGDTLVFDADDDLTVDATDTVVSETPTRAPTGDEVGKALLDSANLAFNDADGSTAYDLGELLAFDLATDGFLSVPSVGTGAAAFKLPTCHFYEGCFFDSTVGTPLEGRTVTLLAKACDVGCTTLTAGSSRIALVLLGAPIPVPAAGLSGALFAIQFRTLGTPASPVVGSSAITITSSTLTSPPTGPIPHTRINGFFSNSPVQPPVPDFTFPTPVTTGKPVTFTASATGGTPPYTFQWDVGKDGTFEGTGETFTHTFPSKGTFSVDLKVTDSAQQTGTVNKAVMVQAQPLTIAASCQSGTAGKPITCSASASGGTAPYTFEWDVGKDGTVDGTGPDFTTTFPSKGSFSIDATVRDANGATAKQNVMVTITAQPLAITASCNDATAGKPINCSASATGGTSPYEFSWDVGKDGSTDGTGAQFATSFPVKGSYSIDAVVRDANGNTDSMNIMVTVTAQPLSADYTFPSTILIGQPATFAGSATGGTVPYTFEWDVGKDGIIDATGPSVQLTFQAKGTVSVDLIVTDTNNVKVTVNKMVPVTGTPITADFTFDPAAPTAGKPVTFTVSSTSGGTAPYEFSWDIGKDGTIDGTGSTLTTSFPAKGTFSIDLVVRDANGAVARFNKMVQVAGQAVVITAQCSDGTAGKPVQCSASATGGTAPYTFTWDQGKDGTIDASGPSVSLVFAAKGTHSVDAIVRDANGAMATTNLAVQIAAQPLAGDFTAPSRIIAGTPAAFTATATGGTTPYMFEWDIGKDGTVDATGQQAQLTFPSPGTVSLDLKITDANTASVTVNKMVLVEVETLPPVAVKTHSPMVIFATEPISFDGSASNDPDGGSIASYNWAFDTGNDGVVDFTATGATPVVSFDAAGIVRVTLVVTDDEGETGSTSQLVTVEPEPLFIRGKVSYTHHLRDTSLQTFTFKISNPSMVRVSITITVNILDEFGMEAPGSPVTGTFILAAGTINTDAAIMWTPPDLPSGTSKSFVINASISYTALAPDGTILASGTNTVPGKGIIQKRFTLVSAD